MDISESIKQDKENDENYEGLANIEMFGVENADIEYYKEWVEFLKERINDLKEENAKLKVDLFKIHAITSKYNDSR